MTLTSICRGFVCAVSLAATGCASFNEMAGNFEKRWEDPDAILNEMRENEPLSEEQKIELHEKLAGLTAGEDCGKIQQSANQILAGDALNTDAHLALAECDLIARNLASAKTRFTTVYDQSADLRAQRGLGIIAVLDGRLEAGKTFLSAVTDADASDWRSWNALGYAEDLEQNWEASERAYRIAADENPNEGAPLNNLGMSYIQQKRYEEAAAAFKSALGRDPALNVARLNLRIAQALSGDYAGALAGASERERAVVLNNIGVAAMSRGELAVAKRYFRQALAENPTFYTVAHENLERAHHLSAK